MKNLFPVIIEASDILSAVQPTDVMFVDLGEESRYLEAHIPGARYVDYGRLNLGQPPAPGLIPSVSSLMQLLNELPVAPGQSRPHIVAYDGEGSGRAARFLWTLDLMGIGSWSLLNGGLGAWTDAGGEAESGPASANSAAPQSLEFNIDTSVRATQSDVLDAIQRDGVTILDCRSAEEYTGADVRAARGGHIPGAINFNWTNAIDMENNAKVLPAAELNSQLAALGVQADNETIVYCQTHHRSSHTYVVLKWLGFRAIRGYDGSWSEWGNAATTPIES